VIDACDGDDTVRVKKEAAWSRALVNIAVGFLVLLGLIYLGLIFVRMHDAPFRGDFSIYYSLAREFRLGRDPYSASLNHLARELGFQPYPFDRSPDTPAFDALFAPLTLLTPTHAYTIWTILSVVAFFGAMVLMLGADRRLTLGARIVLAMMALAFPPVADNLRWSQSQFFVLLGLVAMIRFLSRGADSSAGALLALLGLLRIYPLTMGGHLLAERNWKATISLALTFLAGIVLTILVAPGLSSVGFARSFGVGGASGGSPFDVWIYRPASVSLLAFVSRLLILTGHPHAASGWPKLLITAIVALIVLSLSFVATWRHREHLARNFCLWVVTTLILSPMVWLHYLVLLLIPYGSIAIARFRGQTGRVISAAALLSYCWITITTPLLAELSFVYQKNNFYHLAMSELGFIGVAFAYVVVFAFAAEPGGTRDENSTISIRGATGLPRSAI
jgi:hypothetical protein